MLNLFNCEPRHLTPKDGEFIYYPDYFEPSESEITHLNRFNDLSSTTLKRLANNQKRNNYRISSYYQCY